MWQAFRDTISYRCRGKVPYHRQSMKYSKYDHIQEVIKKRWQQGVLEQLGRKTELMGEVSLQEAKIIFTAKP